jgi:hypothetical protein
MAGKIIADTIESAGSQISLNVGNVTVLTASSDSLALKSGSVTAPSLTFSGNTSTGIFMPAANTIAFGTAGTEDMRIDATGNVGIGTSSPTAPLDVKVGTGNFTVGLQGAGNALLTASATMQLDAAGASAAMVFKTVGSERMRIDSSGNLLVGATAQVWDEKELVRSDTNTVKLGIYGNATSFTSSIIRAQVETAAGTGWYFFEGRAAGGGFQYGIRGNGTVATSDERRKKNIEPARSYLQDICSIPIVKYNWKSDEDTSPKELGWIAQDVQKVFPNMVVTHHDGPNDDQEVLLLKKEVFLPMLMKCIQEQQALITQLQADVAALKAK